MSDDHFLHSRLREKLLEHRFIAEVVRDLWISGCRDFEVLHSMTDNQGYDPAMEARGTLRYIQLKASFLGARTWRHNIHTALASKTGGCVIWMVFEPETLDFDHFLWFGGPPGACLPDLGDRIARHTKGNREGVKAERPDLRVLAKGKLTRLDRVADLVRTLFQPGG